MRRRTTLALAGAVVAVTCAIGVTAIPSASSDDGEQPITGSDLERATGAALAHTGGGRVTDTEDGNEDSRYEVEVTLSDGRQVDVQLDDSFRVVGSADDGPEDGDGAEAPDR